MNKKNCETLIKEAPLLFRDVGGDCTKTCMAWGFECSDGWFPLLLKGSRKLEVLIRKQQEDGVDLDELAVASQVKEKFGTLRFYMDFATDEMHKIVSEMEDKSCVTCETCGQPGQTRGGGWIVTCCDECAPKRGIHTTPEEDKEF